MKKSDVYLIRLPDNSRVSDQIQATKHIMEKAPFDSIMKQQDKVGVKIHVGEKNNDTFVAPEVIKAICSRIKRNSSHPFITETSTLYKGERHNAVDHINHAYAHGFTPQNAGAPIIMADGLLGDNEIEIEIPGNYYKKVNIAKEAVMADALVLVSHVTGHLATGMGATIKNLGMGLASRKGKMRQHSSIKPIINPQKCILCNKCIQWCPENAIIQRDTAAFIKTAECIGCGECFTVCPVDAVKYNWSTGSEELQKKIVEHALGVVLQKKEKIIYFNYMINMTADCDCIGQKQEKVIPDIGIIVSLDPVAIDQVAIDLSQEVCPTNISKESYPAINPMIQLEYGVQLGLGSRDYNLITVS